VNIKLDTDQKKCIVCHELLHKSTFMGNFDHYHCPKHHTKAMYEKEDGNLVFLRIKDPELSFKLEFSVKGKHILITNKNSHATIEIPNFDITQYSYLDLEKKIKTYILFS